MSKEITLDELVTRRRHAKEQEDFAVTARRSLDEAIAARLKDREEGTVSRDVSGFKVTATYKVTRKVDTLALQAGWDKLTDNSRNAFKWGAELITGQYRAMEKLNSPDLAEIARFITTSPASPSIKIEEIK